jgi:hypothetical protein
VKLTKRLRLIARLKSDGAISVLLTDEIKGHICCQYIEQLHTAEFFLRN